MPKTVSASDAKHDLDALLVYVADHDDGVIVEGDGQPRVAIVSIAAYEAMRVARDRQRRFEAVEQLRVLQEEVSARNGDLTEEQAIEFADELVEDALARLVAAGTISFERDRT